MKKSYDWQKRAVPLFTAAVLILCFLLTAFAIREAERERLLKQKELEGELPRIADRIADRFEGLLSEIEEAAFEELSSLKANPGVTPIQEPAAFLENEANLIDLVFFVDERERFEFPFEKPLYEISDRGTESRASVLSALADPLLTAAEVAEFQRRDLAEALRLYREFLSRVTDRSVRVDILSRIGRVSLKSGRPLEAVSVYRDMLESDENQISPDGTPFGLMALYQICVSYSRANTMERTLESAVDLYAALLEPRWRISREKYLIYLRQTKNLRNSLESEGIDEESGADLEGRWRELQRIEDEKTARTTTMENIVKHCLSVIGSERLEGSGPAESFRFTFSSGGQVHWVSLSPARNGSRLGLVFKTGRLVDTVLPEAVGAYASPYPWIAGAMDSSGNLLAGDSLTSPGKAARNLSLSRPLNTVFPDWKIQVSMAFPGPADKAFIKRRNLYILIAMVVTAAVIGGGTMVIRSTAKELKLAKLKAEFVSTVSHEFRTPLTSIRYLAELLERNRVPEESLKHQYYRTITRESERLSRLIENILDFSKIEAGMKKYELTETDAGKLIEEAVALFRGQISNRKFVVRYDVDGELPPVFLDGDAVQRALLNLLDNAVKYSGSSRSVQVRAWADASHLHLSVEDRGIGIEPEEQKRVFEKFHRSEGSAGSHIRGSGIGLTVVSHIVKAHGGKVSLDSAPGEGTTVTIELPIERKNVRGGLK